MTEKEFERIIPDEGIRKYLSGSIDYDLFDHVSNYVKVYQNTINLAFVYAFSCYLSLKNNNYSTNGVLGKLDKCIRSGNSNSLRVLRTMQNIYGRYPMSNELIQFILADIHYDFIQGENSKLDVCFPNCVYGGDYWKNKGASLNDYFSVINENIDSSRAVKGFNDEELTLPVADDYLRMLFNFFPFLSTTKLVFDENAKWFYFDVGRMGGSLFPDGKIYTYGLINKCFVQSQRRFYFLTAIDEDHLTYESPSQDRVLSCPLVGLGSEGSYSKKEPELLKRGYEIPLDYETIISYFNPSLVVKDESVKVDASMEQLYNINYKYMKNLALAIADVIGKKAFHECGERLETVFAKKYPHAFELYQGEDKNWDSIVVILLIEAGPSVVLQQVLYACDDAGDDIVANLRRRLNNSIGNRLTSISTDTDLTTIAYNMLGNQRIDCKDNDEIVKYNKELIAKAKARIILSSLAEIELVDDDCEDFHTDNLQQNILMLENVRESNDLELKVDLVKRLLSESLKKVICFYQGVFAYGRHKVDFDNRTRRSVLSKNDIKLYQNKAESAFIKAATEEYETLKEVNSLVELISRLISICDDCCKTETSIEQERTVKSRYIYSVLGKNTIMNTSAFKKVVNINELVEIDTQNADWWLDTAVKVLKFLINANTDENTKLNRSFNSIAPVIASYSNHSDNKDGYDTATFTLIFDANELNGKSMEINMLSEFSYEISMRYYCLPNLVRSNRKWWIDPLVIKCRDFDNIFME